MEAGGRRAEHWRTSAHGRARDGSTLGAMAVSALSESSCHRPADADTAPWEPGYAVRWRHADTRFAVGDWACPGIAHGAPSVGADEEEIPAQIEINLQRCGWHLRSVAGRDYLIDPNGASLWPNDAGYRLSHNRGRPQAATLMFVAPEAFESALSDVPGSGRASLPRLLGSPSVLRSDRVALAHAELLASKQRLDVEERSLALLRHIVTDALDTRARSKPASAREISRIVRGCAYIAAHYREDLSIEAIASAAGMSPSRFSTRFPDVVGMSVWRHVTMLRLRMALQAIADDDDHDLTALAFRLGFSSHSHFTARFRAQYGRTPSALRAALRRLRHASDKGP